MIVTAIKHQVKRAGRYSIFIDGKYAFSLSETGLLESRLTNGQEVSREELAIFKQMSEADKLYNLVLHLTALRPRSEWEIHMYLKRKHSPAPLSTEILNKLSNMNLINDMSFARSWVDSRRLLKLTSRRRLTQELRAKRIAENIIEEVLKGDVTDEHVVLRDLIIRKRQQSRYQNTLKLMQYLARQGFSYGDIKSTLQELDSPTE